MKHKKSENVENIFCELFDLYKYKWKVNIGKMWKIIKLYLRWDVSD